MINGNPRILLIRLSAIGDVVRVLPGLHVLREAFPKARIDWAVEHKAAAIVEGHPALDKVLVFDRREGFVTGAKRFLRLCKTVHDNRYDMIIDFHGILKSGLITGLSGAKKRYGFAPPRSREGSSWFTNHRVPLESERLNRVAENLALCEAIAPGHGWPNVTLYVPTDVQESVDRFFEETFDGGKLVVAVHVPVDRDEKRWPEERFAELVDLLLADGRFEVLLTWGPGQRETAAEVARRSRRDPVVAPETSDLKHYAWLAHRSDLYFGGDTGPMHIAWVMGTPVVAVFGGTDPAKHAPYRRPHVVLHNGTAAPSSDKTPAQGHPADITAEQAYDACIQMVARKCETEGESGD